MERSRVAVEYKHLQQQVFEHEAAGVNCVVQSITGGQPEHLTLAQALDAVETRIARWTGPMEGFARPVTGYADSYQLVVPGVVQWDLWPRVFVCDRCGAGVPHRARHRGTPKALRDRLVWRHPSPAPLLPCPSVRAASGPVRPAVPS